MSKLEVDAAKPCDIAALEQYYEKHVVRLDSPTPSSRTVSSTCSVKDSPKLSFNSSESSTASNSDVEELELDAVPKYPFNQLQPSPTTTEGNVIVVKNVEGAANGPRIDSIAIQHSSDIQFGNKTFYNGPVVIKQFLLDDKNNKWISRRSSNEANEVESGVLNDGFADSQNTVNGSPCQIDSKPESCDTEFFKIKDFTFKRRNVLLASLTAFCALVAIILLAWFLVHSEKSSDDLLLRKVLRLVTRDEWLAQPPNEELVNLNLPVGRVVITHTATESCETQAACTLRVRLMQTYHMESKNWDDIGYNFLVGGDGDVYEGRGWDKQGAHTKGYNSGSIGIAYIGTFNRKLPNEQQLQAGFQLMNEGVKLKKLTPDYKIYAHRQLIASESPGAAFFELIKTWDHWTKDVPEVV